MPDLSPTVILESHDSNNYNKIQCILFVKVNLHTSSYISLLIILIFRRACDIDKKEKINNTKYLGNSKVSIAVDDLENNKITEAIGVNKAWKQNSDEEKNTKEQIPYTYEDLSIMLNKICFVFFLILTILLDIMFLLILMIGGGSSG